MIQTEDENNIMYRKKSDGQFVLASFKTIVHPTAIGLPHFGPQLADAEPPKNLDSTSLTWDGWPDGNFELDLTFKQYEESGRLQVHWATATSGGDRKGYPHASTWKEGKRQTGRCLGNIECTNPECQIVVRPHVKPHGIAKLLGKPCDCGAPLFHKECDARSYTWTWSGGIHYLHQGFHTHWRPTRILHLLPGQADEFKNLVDSHPKIGPLGLVCGVPGLVGPGKSAADISDALLNANRVSYERQKIIRGGKPQTMDGLLKQFADFDRTHPKFVLQCTFGEVTVVSFQTPFMRSQMVKKDWLDGPINRLVNDAAHGWWLERNHLLMVTSTYCPITQCWVPGVLTFTNGASAAHFQLHFYAVMLSMSREADERGIQVTDPLFAGMMDFSEAKRVGFIKAFITFWMQRPENTWTHSKLQIAAKSILKGCREHYRAGVTRVSRMTTVVPPDMADDFKTRAMTLLDLSNSEDFLFQVKLIIQDFPKLMPWMDWWRRPSHASLLFESEQKMDINLWNSIPETNNAEEAMHWKLYSACGRNHLFLEGIHSLYAVAVYDEKLYNAATNGQPIRYGQAEPWKIIAERTGHTKPTRSSDPEAKKQKRNDGRPPDTAKELIQKKRKSRKEIVTLGPPAYKWHSNSCYLDTSLQLLYCGLSKSLNTLSEIFESLPSSSGLRHVLFHLVERSELSTKETEINLTEELASERDEIRKMLLHKGFIQKMDSFELLWVWFSRLMTADDVGDSFHPISLFEILFFEIHMCSGSEKTAGRHIETPKNLVQRRLHQVTLDDHTKFHGSFTDCPFLFIAAGELVQEIHYVMGPEKIIIIL